MFNIDDFKAIVRADISIGLILVGKILARIDMQTLSVATSIAGLVVAILTAISLLIKMRKDWRETPDKPSKMKKFFNHKK